MGRSCFDEGVRVSTGFECDVLVWKRQGCDGIGLTRSSLKAAFRRQPVLGLQVAWCAAFSRRARI